MSLECVKSENKVVYSTLDKELEEEQRKEKIKQDIQDAFELNLAFYANDI